MRVEFMQELRSPAPNDKMTEIVNETIDYMKRTEQVNPLTPQGMEEMVSDRVLFKKYVDHLCEGMTVDVKDSFIQLAANSYKLMLNESTTSSMAPLSMLTLPMLRRAWPKIGIKEAIPTEVAKQPVFKKNTLRPYITLKEPVVAHDHTGATQTRKKYELPGDPTKHSLTEMRSRFKKTTLRRLGKINDDGYVTVSGKQYAPDSVNARATTSDEGAITVDGSVKGDSSSNKLLDSGTTNDWMTTHGYDHDQVNGYTISSRIGILGVELQYYDTATVCDATEHAARHGSGSGIAAAARTIRLPLGFRGEMYSAVEGEQGKYMTLTVVDETLSGSDGTQVYSNPQAMFHPETGSILLNLKLTVDSLGGTGTNVGDVEATGGIMGVFERGAWQFMAQSLNTGAVNNASKTKFKINKVFLDGALETTQNRNALQVGFDIDTRNIEIPTGEHIEANLGLEWLQDMLAMYNIDGVLQVTSILSDVIVNKVDIEGFEFIEDTFDRFAAQLDQGRSADGGSKIAMRTFDLYPPARFNGSVHEWIDSELKRIINNLAATLRNLTYFNEGTFVLVGNPVNVDLLSVHNWHYVEGDEGDNGVTMGYSMGEYKSGTMRYKLFASQNVEYDPTDADGDVNALWLFFIPNHPEYKTLCYFPYTFNVMKTQEGFVSPNNPNVPAVMMSKRHTFEEFFKVYGKIKIKNNTGTTGTAS